MYSGSNGTFDDEYIRYVLETYSVTIIRLCYSYVKNMHDAEDIAQDTFCELVKHAKQCSEFSSPEHEKAWLLKTAANKCKNHLKSSWVRKTVSLEENLSAVDEQAEVSEKGPDDENSAVLKAVMALPLKYRTVIHMYYYDGLSIAEIAEVKDLSPNTVGTQLARGRELLRKKLGGGI